MAFEGGSSVCYKGTENGCTVRGNGKNREFKETDFIEMFCDDFDVIMKSHVTLPMLLIDFVEDQKPPLSLFNRLTTVIRGLFSLKPLETKEDLEEGWNRVFGRVIKRLATKQVLRIKSFYTYRKKFHREFYKLCDWKIIQNSAVLPITKDRKVLETNWPKRAWK
uniref:Uncharacterized protein n=1 Tax=Caenorhabditis tropicalis TaxID=1561998 RepID=A0A1I7TEA8_9PELO